MEPLPRDMQLCIVRRLDMDGRIACGVIGRIRTPAPLAQRIGKVLAFKAYVHATDEHWLLDAPYNTHLSDLERPSPSGWLDRWHAHELPKLHAFLSVFRDPKYAWMQQQQQQQQHVYSRRS